MKKIISRTINLAFLLMLSGCFAGTKQDFAGIPSSQNEQNQQEKSLEQTTVSTKNSTGKYGTADAIADLQKMGEGDSIFMHSTRRGKIYHHKHYFLSYSERDEQAEWVSYELTYDEVTNTSAKKEDFFNDDPIIETGSATYSDYSGTGYDRGHMAPSADFRFDKTAQIECYYMSNMSPQIHAFNAGLWNDLESMTRYWARLYDRVYIVTGPLLTGKEQKLVKKKGDRTIKTKVSIPTHHFKVVFDYSNKKHPKMIAFLMPNEKNVKGKIMDYAMSVRELENKTGLDFFKNMPKKTQDYLETYVKKSEWKTYDN